MNRNLKILLLADAFNIFASAVLAPIYAVFVQEIGGNLLTISSSFAIFPLSSALMIYLFSRIQDRTDRPKQFMMASYLLFAFGYGLYLFVNTGWELFLIQMILGVAYAIGTPAYKSVYVKNLNVKKTASQLGNLEINDQLLTGLAAIVGGTLATFFGFKVLFGLMAGLAWLSMLIIIKFLPEDNK